MATNEGERYCVWPGQACSYMVGKTAWLNHRERARRALGELFDIRDFHRATLAVGAVYLTILDGVVDDYIAEAHARRRGTGGREKGREQACGNGLDGRGGQM